MPDTQSSLIEEYAKLKNQQQSLQHKLENLESRILSFAQKNKLKRLKSANGLLYVVRKIQVVFPRQGTNQRRLLEKIISSSSDKDKVFSFDIIKLARIYKQKKLSHSLMAKLKPFVQKKPFVKISLVSAHRS